WLGASAHVRPDPAPHLQDADVNQRADLLADGGTAHAEPRGQVRLRRYALADRPRTPADLRLKLVEHGVDGRTRAHGTQTHRKPPRKTSDILRRRRRAADREPLRSGAGGRSPDG